MESSENKKEQRVKEYILIKNQNLIPKLNLEEILS
jgi:hypothetical protein